MRSWNDQTWAQSSVCSFWQTLTRISLRPALSVPLPTVLVEAVAVVVLLAEEELLAVEEDLDGVGGRGPQLDRLLLRRIDDREGVTDHALVLADGLVQIDDAILARSAWPRLVDRELLPVRPACRPWPDRSRSDRRPFRADRRP